MTNRRRNVECVARRGRCSVVDPILPLLDDSGCYPPNTAQRRMHPRVSHTVHTHKNVPPPSPRPPREWKTRRREGKERGRAVPNTPHVLTTERNPPRPRSKRNGACRPGRAAHSPSAEDWDMMSRTKRRRRAKSPRPLPPTPVPPQSVRLSKTTPTSPSISRAARRGRRRSAHRAYNPLYPKRPPEEKEIAPPIKF
jgi:hypothetical protein